MVIANYNNNKIHVIFFMALIPWRILPRWLMNLHSFKITFKATHSWKSRPKFITTKLFCYIYHQPVKFLKLLKQRNILFLDIGKKSAVEHVQQIKTWGIHQTFLLNKRHCGDVLSFLGEVFLSRVYCIQTCTLVYIVRRSRLAYYCWLHKCVKCHDYIDFIIF